MFVLGFFCHLFLINTHVIGFNFRCLFIYLEQKNKFSNIFCPAIRYIFSLLKKQEKGCRFYRGSTRSFSFQEIFSSTMLKTINYTILYKSKSQRNYPQSKSNTIFLLQILKNHLVTKKKDPVFTGSFLI